MFQQNYF